MAYEAGLQKEPDNAILKKGLDEVKNAMDRDAFSGPGGDMGLGKLFSDPNIVSKLQNNPKTAEFMKDPAFAAKIAALKNSGGQPDVQSLFGDTRMLTVLGVLMGVDIDAMERPEGSDATPPGFQQQPPQASSSSSPPPRAASPKKASPPPAPKDEPMDVEPNPDAEAKKEADELKLKGTAAYKARKFDEAIELYSKAWETYPKDVAYLSNLSAVYFEKGDYQKAIETAEKAVEEGRELRADYKVIARAYGRIGTSYTKLNDLDNAIKFYQKSLTEHRTPDILAKLREVEKAKAESARLAYLDPAKADEAREEGNAAFKAGNFADAVKAYSEAIKRGPTDPRSYTNRAAAYTKLLALPEALKDANEAIKQDPTFIKAYIRKALVQQGMKDHTAALETLQKAAEADKDHKHTNELQSNMAKVMGELQAQRSTETDEETYERAMRDPEVQSIMSDPIMRQILSDAQQNPAALQDHMKNPSVAAKIQKLINAGIIRTR